MNKEKQREFEEVARPLIKWMAENVHPHHTAIITATGGELMQGVTTTGTILDYLQD